ncbi:MAG: T9SS type A sorting domain-containing protein [Flavobacteriales bacterium]
MNTFSFLNTLRTAGLLTMASIATVGMASTPPGGGPPNDDCASVLAQSLEPGSPLTLTGNNAGAVATGDWDANSPFFGAPVVWHAFTTTQCTNITVSYCGQAPVWANTFGVLATTCPGNTVIFPSSFNTTDCLDGNTTYILNQVAAGTYYLPVLNDPGNNSSGPYSIAVSATGCGPTQGSDLCVAVVPDALAGGSTLTFTGDNTNATATNDFVSGSPFAGAPVVWHAFTLSSCADVTVSYCGLAPTWNNTLGILSTDCPADSLIFLSGSDNTSCGDGNITYFFNGLDAGTYYLPVLRDAGNNAIGPYSIEVSAEDCPNNQGSDFCSQVIPLALANGTSLTFTGDNTNATPTADFVIASPFAGAPVVWHAFTTSECADVTVAYCGLAPTWSNTLGILTTDCPGDNIIFLSSSNTTACGDGNVTYNFDELPAGTYYLPVLLDAGNNAIGPYSIEVSAENCPSTQGSDVCGDVIPELLPPTGTYTFTGDNTNATPFGDWAAGNPFSGAPVAWHAFIVDQCEDLSISFCGQVPAWGGQFGILSPDCPADSIIFPSNFNTSDCGDGNVTYNYDELAAGTYYFPVVLNAGQNSVGAYTLTLTTVSCSPLAIGSPVVTEFTIVPNPNDGSFMVNGVQAGQLITVLDVAGRTVRAEQVTNNTMVLDLRGTVAQGTYVVRVSGGQGSRDQLLMVR